MTSLVKLDPPEVSKWKASRAAHFKDTRGTSRAPSVTCICAPGRLCLEHYDALPEADRLSVRQALGITDVLMRWAQGGRLSAAQTPRNVSANYRTDRRRKVV